MRPSESDALPARAALLHATVTVSSLPALTMGGLLPMDGLLPAQSSQEFSFLHEMKIKLPTNDGNNNTKRRFLIIGCFVFIL